MNLAEFSIKNQLLCVIAIILVFVGGINAYTTMPRFEDPEFTIRNALIYTQYPGASPDEVAREVTDPLETALQQLQEVKSISSTSSTGVSELNVEIKYEFSTTKEDLQVIWTKLRNKISDAQSTLPPDALTPIVNDDFGDLYGLSYLITGNDYSYAELQNYAKQLQKDLLQVDGVAKVQLAGNQQEAIFVEISQENAAGLGLSINKIYDILKQQNSITFSGSVDVGDLHLSFSPSGNLSSIESIKNLLVSDSSDGRVIYLKDIANVYRGYKQPTQKLIRFNGQKAIAMGVSNVSGGNVVEIGKAVDAKILEADSRRPIGIEVNEYYNQGKVVEASVTNFLVNVISALVIVVCSLLFTMGVRSAAVISFILLVTVGATLTTMQLMGIPLHRISLGALIISLGMMVDNAVVITEAILVGVKQGRRKLDIAKEIVKQTKWPLLAGTLVGVIAFAPIGFAPGQTAEYTGSLFWVVMISLLFSWVLALTITPLTCYWLFPQSSEPNNTKPEQIEEGAFFKKYKVLMRWCLRSRALVISSVIILFVLSIWGAQFMTQGFFPRSTSPQMVVDFWLPEGTNINKTEREMIKLESFVQSLDNVKSVQTLVGGGAIRYMLTYSPQSANTAYGQLLVKVDDYKKIDSMTPIIQQYVIDNFPEAESKTWRFILGPGGGSAIEAEFSGPTPAVLRSLAEQAKKVMSADSKSVSVKDDWRQKVPVIEPIYSEDKARLSGVSRKDLSQAIAHFYNGEQIGTFREGNDLIPIISQTPMTRIATLDNLKSIQVISSVTGKSVPILQVTDGFETIWRDSRVKSEDRIFMIKAQADPVTGELSSELLARVKPQIESIPLPSGYTLTWGGEYGDSSESNGNLMSTIPLGFLAMVLVVVISFGKIRQPLVIWSVVPLALIGVVFGLVVTGVPLEFMGILGLLSLSGLLIQNGIILVDRMDTEIAEGKPRFDAIVDSASSRVRPVLLGSFTTALGVIPLFFDAFFQSMAVVIVFGLSFATLLTLLIVPVLYATFLRVSRDETSINV